MTKYDLFAPQPRLLADAKKVASRFDSIADYEYYKVFLPEILRKLKIEDTPILRKAIDQVIAEQYAHENDLDKEA